jgi:hypothetical protein
MNPFTKYLGKEDHQMKKYNYYIGIDCGVNTGFAVWNKSMKKFIRLDTLAIHEAMAFVKNYCYLNVFVRVEDAKQRKWFGDRSNAKQQGAGSVKRDCKIWEDFLTDLKVDFEMVAPRKGMTKHTAETFRKITGYSGKTSNHARDAAMLVYGF